MKRRCTLSKVAIQELEALAISRSLWALGWSVSECTKNASAVRLLARAAESVYGVLADEAFLVRNLDDVLLGDGLPPPMRTP